MRSTSTTRTTSRKERIFKNVSDQDVNKFFMTIDDQVNAMFLPKDLYLVDGQTQEETVDHEKDDYENGIKEL